jgi:hypothetical protein
MDAMVPALARFAPISIGSRVLTAPEYAVMNSGEPNRPGRRTSFWPRLRKYQRTLPSRPVMGTA